MGETASHAKVGRIFSWLSWLGRVGIDRRPRSSAEFWISQLIEIHIRCLACSYFFSCLTRGGDQAVFFSLDQFVPLCLFPRVFHQSSQFLDDSLLCGFWK